MEGCEMERIYYVIRDNEFIPYTDLWDIAKECITDERIGQYYGTDSFSAEQKEYHLGQCHTHLKRDSLKSREGTTYYVDDSLGQDILIYWVSRN
jgi:hypothetical protein